MIIAVDTSIVTYALKAAFLSQNYDEVNYICQRITEATPQMQRTLCLWIKQDITDYLDKNDLDYLKARPIEGLLESVTVQLKEFRD
jgi:hypothetical protein